MLSRVALGSLLLVGVVGGAAHADPTDAGLATSLASDSAASASDDRVEGVVGITGAGVRYLELDDNLYLDLQASVDSQRKAASAKLGLARFTVSGVEHELVAGAGFVEANASTVTDTTAAESQFAQTMATHTALTGRLRREHRFLSAYINDTVRFIRGLDVTGGLAVEQWSNLGGDSTITYGSGPPMDVETPDIEYLFGPSLSLTGHLGEHVDVVAQSFRGVREVGPDVAVGRFTTRLRAFDSAQLGQGLAGEASIQPVAPLIATVAYIRTEDRDLASALVSYCDPRVATLTARLDTNSRLDALAVRSLHGGLSGYLGADNLLGEALEPRRFHIGIRGAFAVGR